MAPNPPTVPAAVIKRLNPVTAIKACAHLICRVALHYAHARKRAHVGFTVLILMVEFTAIAIVHDPHLHFTLAGTVAAWELLILSLAE